MSKQIEKEIIARVNEVLTLARKKYPRHEIPTPAIQFALTGISTAGRARRTRKFGKDQFRLDFNVGMAANPKNYEVYMSTTITHEVAHMVDCIVYGGWGHSGSWYRTMNELGIEKPQRCSSFDTSHQAVKTKGRNATKFEYKCNCSTHLVGKVGHSNAQRHLTLTGNQYYTCKKCKTKLVFVSDTKPEVTKPVVEKKPVTKPTTFATPKDFVQAHSNKSKAFITEGLIAQFGLAYNTAKQYAYKFSK